MIVAQETNKNWSVGQHQHIIFPTSLHISPGYPRPLVALLVSTGQIFYIECMNSSTNCSKFVCQRRFVSLSQDSADDGVHSEEPGRDPGAALPRCRPRTEKQGRLELLPHRLQRGRPCGHTAPAPCCTRRLEDGEQDTQDATTHRRCLYLQYVEM